MKTFLLILLTAFILSTAATSAPVQGIVTDPNGKPIPKAKVLAIWNDNGGKQMHATTTNTRGVFSLIKKPGWLTVQAMAGGYSVAQTMADSGSHDQLIHIALKPEKLIKGLVVDEHGKPLPNVSIAIERFNGNVQNSRINESYESYGLLHETRTAADGSFTLHHIPNTESYHSFDLMIDMSGNRRARIMQDIEAKDLACQLRLVDPPGCVLQGKLYFPGKTSAAPEGIMLRAIPDAIGRSMFRTYTDKDGNFKFSELPPGKVSLLMYFINGQEPSPHNWLLPATTVELPPYATTNHDLVGIHGTRLTVKVLDKASGRPMPDALLIIKDSRNQYMPIAFTGIDGGLSCRVAPGEVKILVSRFNVYNGTSSRIISIDQKTAPSYTFTAVDGVDKSDIKLEVDVPEIPADKRAAEESAQEQQPDYSADTKPIPPGFKLIPGTYSLTWNEGIDWGNACGLRDEYKGEIKPLFKNLPAFKSAKPHLGAFRVDGSDGSGLLLFALDESKGTGQGYDTAYIDQNRNGDLSHDKPLMMLENPDVNLLETPWVSITSHQGKPGDSQTQHPLHVQLGYQIYQGTLHTNISCKGCWTGLIDTSSGKAQIAVADINANGIYGDKTLVKDGNIDHIAFGDGIYINANSSKNPNIFSVERDMFLLADAMRIGESLYTFRISDTGDQVTVSQYAGPTGVLSIPTPHLSGLTASIDMPLMSTSMVTPVWNARTMTLPVGCYYIPEFELKLGSKRRKQLSVYCNMGPGIVIKEGQVTTLKIGGEITSKISPDIKNLILQAGKSESIKWVISIGGSANLESLQGEGPRHEPIAELFDQKGKLVGSAELGYPKYRDNERAIQVPNLKPGTYTLKISLDTKSELGVISAKRPVKVIK